MSNKISDLRKLRTAVQAMRLGCKSRAGMRRVQDMATQWAQVDAALGIVRDKLICVASNCSNYAEMMRELDIAYDIVEAKIKRLQGIVNEQKDS